MLGLRSSLLVVLLGFAKLPVVWAAVDADGVPYPNDISVRIHQTAQQQLLEAEHKHRHDWAFRQSLTPTAKLADALVAEIRRVEIRNIWTVAGAFGNESSETYAGEPFARARPLIATTDLYKVVRKLPKGALLHAHLSAMLPYEVVFQTVLNTPGMVLSAATDLSTDAKRNWTSIAFSHSNATALQGLNATAGGGAAAASIWSAGYVPNTLVPVGVAADTFPGGRIAFLAFLMDKVMLSVEDSDESELGVDAIWRKFQGIFSTVGTPWDYEPLYRQFLQDLFGALADDGIRWVEIRSGGSSGIVKTGDSTWTPDPDYFYQAFIQELNKFKATAKGKHFWGARIIWTVARGQPREKIIANMKRALIQKQKFPQLLSGYDLVAQEDLGRPLADVAPELIWFRNQTEALNLTMPYFFHAGETLGDGNATDDNLFDALLFNTRRVGHGFSLFKHPVLMEAYRDHDIAIEVCLISNEALRLNGDVRQHPLPAMIAHGVPTSLSNDDPAIEGQDVAGVSYDFYEAVQGFENIGLAGLGALAQNSIKYSNFEDQSDLDWVRHIEAADHGTGIKARHLRQWKEEWEQFCAWVVEEFGGKYNARGS